MRRIYIIFLAMLASVACTMDDVKDVNLGSEIEFRAVATKGVEITMSNFEIFQATALKPGDDPWFFEEEFTNGGGGSSFVSPGKKYYWPTDGSTLTFFAYYPYGQKLGGTVNVTNDSQTLEGFTTGSTGASITNQVDFISAVAEGSIETQGAVGLEFQHNLTQIEVKGRNSNAGYKCMVAGMRIANVISGGDFDFKTRTWTPDDQTAVYTVIYDEPRELGELSVSMMPATGDNAMLVPQSVTAWDPVSDPSNTAEGAYIALLVNIATVSDIRTYPILNTSHDYRYPEYDWVAVPVSGTWEMGTRYVYTWDIPKVSGYVYPEKVLEEGSTDIFIPGKPVMGSAITASYLDVNVGGWTYKYME